MGGNPFDEARELLHAELAKSPDEGVRLLNEIATLALPDDDPHVEAIASAIVQSRNAGRVGKSVREALS